MNRWPKNAPVFDSPNRSRGFLISSLNFNYLVLIVLIWAACVLIVNPVGEFMVNDDWAFTRAMETFTAEGRIESTGWGPSWAPGGPSLVAQLLWARLFTSVRGYSLTVLRISVLFAGILSTLALWAALRFTGNSRPVCFYAVLTLLFNPLFFSQCFTFMTDITFVAFVILSMTTSIRSIENSSKSVLTAGLLFALFAILTRQIGIVVPLAFVIAFVMTKPTGEFRIKTLLICITLIVLVPWIAYECHLFLTGGTPLIRHQVFHRILGRPAELGIGGYLGHLVSNFAVLLVYVGFLISPIIVLARKTIFKRASYRIFFCGATILLLFFETMYFAGFLKTSIDFHRNVIFNFGIGPILLKDTYILGIKRTWTISQPLIYFLIYWGAISGAGLLLLMYDSVRIRMYSNAQDNPAKSHFTAGFALIAAILYSGTIILSGFHDRYLIPSCVFLIIWLLSEKRFFERSGLVTANFLLGSIPLAFMAVLSIGGTHDFMAMKNSLKRAQDYVVQEKHVSPCNFDGGLEFNGYHCYQPDFEPAEGLSWWWVKKEDYLLTLGPLSGYRVVKSFPFGRYLGPPGEVTVLSKIKSSVPERH